MARINIEDQFWVEIMPLVLAMSDQDRAIGHAVRFFKFAQDKHKQGKLIGEDEFKRHGFSEALIPLFADRTPDGIKCAGAEKHFNWLRKKMEAGTRGGLAKASKRKQNLAKASKPKQALPSYSSSYSSSPSSSDSNSFLNTLPVPMEPATNPIKIYCDLWKEKNGKSPDIRPKEAGQLNKLAKDVGINRAKEIMTTYFSMPDPLFMKRGYDVGTMLLNLAAISQFEVHHKIVTSEAVKQIEKQVDKIQGTKRRRSIEEVQAEYDAQRSLALVEGGKDAG